MPTLDDELKIPAEHVLLQKNLRSLSRERLVALAIEWSQTDSPSSCQPSVDPDATASINIQAVSPTLDAVRNLYSSLLADKANKQEIIERMCTVDWKTGLSLGQLAQVESGLLDQKPDSLTWNALRVKRMAAKHDDVYQKFATPEPVRQIKITADQLIEGLQRDLGFLLNMHFFAGHDSSTGLDLLRVALVGDYDVLDKSRLHAINAGALTLGSFWLAFRSSALEIYYSVIPSPVPQIQDVGSLILDAISRALSSPEDRVLLEKIGEAERSLNGLHRKTQGWPSKYVIVKSPS